MKIDLHVEREFASNVLLGLDPSIHVYANLGYGLLYVQLCKPLENNPD